MYKTKTTTQDLTTTTTNHRSIIIAMKRAAAEWTAGARAAIVYGTHSSYEIERTQDGIYGRLRTNSVSREVVASELFWNELARAFDMPELKTGPVTWIAPADGGRP
jgi:hypothetical protein